jgi:hypothetical protein
MNDKLPIPWANVECQLKTLNLEPSYLFHEDLQAPPSWFEVPMSGDLKGAALSLCPNETNQTWLTMLVVHRICDQARAVGRRPDRLQSCYGFFPLDREDVCFASYPSQIRPRTNIESSESIERRCLASITAAVDSSREQNRTNGIHSEQD